MVTGATSGIGKATAAALAGRGAQVVLVSRDRGRGEAAVAELAAAGGPAPRLEVADLASMGQVRTLADRLGALERIDVLINNAGFMAGQRRVTVDGFDEVFAVNHLAPFLLTNLLLGKLAAAGPARVITLTSDAHTAARLDLDHPPLKHGWPSWRISRGRSCCRRGAVLALSFTPPPPGGGWRNRRLLRQEPAARAVTGGLDGPPPAGCGSSARN